MLGTTLRLTDACSDSSNQGNSGVDEGCLMLQGSNVEAARGLAYLLNANLTISGGCPYPPLSARLSQEVHLPVWKKSHFHEKLSWFTVTLLCPTVSDVAYAQPRKMACHAILMEQHNASCYMRCAGTPCSMWHSIVLQPTWMLRMKKPTNQHVPFSQVGVGLAKAVAMANASTGEA